MPPKFSLQNILDYQHNRVELLEVDLNRLVMTRQQVLDTLSALSQEMDRMFGELSDFQNGELDLQAITRARFMIKRLQNQIATQQVSLQAVEQAIQNKKAEVIQARQDEAVLENLRDKEKDRFLQKIVEQEKRLVDDIYISKAHARVGNKL